MENTNEVCYNPCKGGYHMNVYDFDDTIYEGDSTFDFYKFCLKKKPSIIFRFPVITALAFVLGFEKKLVFKEKFYRFLQALPDTDAWVCAFWDAHLKNIKPWYKSQQKEDDVIISASPEFLLTPACARLGISFLMASRVDKHTGKYTGENCWGEEKVLRFREKFPDAVVDAFYSDSLSDTPMARLGKVAYIIKGTTLTEWKEYESTHKK